MAAPKYKFATIARADNQVRDLLAKAALLGIQDDVIRALQTAYNEMRSRPEKFGEPSHNTRKKGGVVCNAVVEPISIHYVVYRHEKAVILLDVRPLTRFFPES
jgi:histidinol dehydrogenase